MRQLTSLILALVIFGCGSNASAENFGYRMRPKIVRARQSDAPISNERAQLYRSLVSLAAETTALHTNEPIFVLGRDMEVFYDVITYLQMKSKNSGYKNIRLINVSRLHAAGSDEPLRNYLESVGYAKAVADGPVNIFDVGYEGRIVAKIRQLYPEYSQNVAAQFLISNHEDVTPSSRIMLEQFHTEAAKITQWSSAWHGVIVEQTERLDRFYERSGSYGLANGKMDAVVSPTSPSTVKSAQEFQNELKYYLNNQGLEKYSQMIGKMNVIVEAMRGASAKFPRAKVEKAIRGLSEMQAAGFLADLHLKIRLEDNLLTYNPLSYNLLQITIADVLGRDFILQKRDDLVKELLDYDRKDLPKFAVDLLPSEAELKAQLNKLKREQIVNKYSNIASQVSSNYYFKIADEDMAALKELGSREDALYDIQSIIAFAGSAMRCITCEGSRAWADLHETLVRANYNREEISWLCMPLINSILRKNREQRDRVSHIVERLRAVRQFFTAHTINQKSDLRAEFAKYGIPIEVAAASQSAVQTPTFNSAGNKFNAQDYAEKVSGSKPDEEQFIVNFVKQISAGVDKIELKYRLFEITKIVAAKSVCITCAHKSDFNRMRRIYRWAKLNAEEIAFVAQPWIVTVMNHNQISSRKNDWAHIREALDSLAIVLTREMVEKHPRLLAEYKRYRAALPDLAKDHYCNDLLTRSGL